LLCLLRLSTASAASAASTNLSCQQKPLRLTFVELKLKDEISQKNVVACN